MAVAFPNIAHMQNMLYGHTDPTFLHKYAKSQENVTSTSHVIEKYVPKMNIPTKLVIYAIYAQYLDDVCAYMCHI